MKNIVEFRREDEEIYIIDLFAYAINDKEHKEIREFLKQYNTIYDLIDADSIKCKIKIEGYQNAIKTLGELEQNGWVF